MDIEKFEIKGKGNVQLKAIKVLPKKEPKAIIQIFHGMGEHKNRYIPFMEFMAENGYACYAHDHRKHGESITVENGYGLFEKNDRWDDVLDDAYFITRKILKDYPGKKIIIMGHSMGSIIAREFIAKNPLVPHAAILMGTLPPYSAGKAIAPKILGSILATFNTKKRSKFMAEIVNKPMLKTYNQPRTKFDWLTVDEQVVDAYIEDPLCGYAYTPKFYLEFVNALVRINKSSLIMRTKDIPMLFISGKDDPVGEFGEGVKEIYRVYNGHGYTQLKVHIVENERHEILNGPKKDETRKEILQWCDQTLV